LLGSTNRSYYSYNEYLQKTFGGKTYKIVVSSGLTCPTRDGTIAKRGCAFCDVRGSSSFHGKKGRGQDVRDQIDSRLPSIQKRFNAEKFLAYFQSYTNTYSDIDYLREIYGEALSYPGISGLCIGTRPDCIPDPVIDLLEEYGKQHYVNLELGIQSFENETLEWLARGHDRDCSIDALERLRKRAPHVQVCAHFMFGSPTDTPNMAKDAADLLNNLGVHGAKLHQLMVLENTDLADRWKKEPFPMLSFEQYAEKAFEFMEYLSPDIYIERLYATATHPDECLAPAWSRERWNPHNDFLTLMDQRKIIQGSRRVFQ
jgi:uncharacterized protein